MQGSNRAYGWRMTQPYPTQSAPPTPLPAGVLLTPKINYSASWDELGVHHLCLPREHAARGARHAGRTDCSKPPVTWAYGW